MRTQQLPQLSAASAVFVYHSLVLGAQVAKASGTRDLSDAQIAGVVIGSVGGALLLGVLAFIVCYLCASRGRRTGDLTWSKTADVEIAVQNAHQSLPGPCEEDQGVGGRRAEGGATADGIVADSSCFNNANRTNVTISTATGQSVATVDGAGEDLSACLEVPQSPTRSPRLPLGLGGRKVGFFRGRNMGHSVGSGVVQLFVKQKRFLRHSSGSIKDKHLEVSRSARVEPSAELELAEPFQPAATNMGPPLSKSSMLLRWLNGADEGLPEAAAVAAQLAAAAAAVTGDMSANRGSGRISAGRAGAGSAGGAVGLGTALDRLPLLSLAAQQTGIVWNKMPPSVASSPAVSVVESSSMHMLRGSLKRPDVLLPEATATHSGHHTHGYAVESLANMHGGDNQYPASFAQASMESLNDRGLHRRSAAGGVSNSGGHSGIVYNYVMRPTASTAGSRVDPGDIVPNGSLAPPSNSNVGKAVQTAPPTGFGADDAFMMGVLPDEHMLAQATQRTSTPPAQDTASSPSTPSRPWLHQIPPTKLTALQETETEEDDAEDTAALTPVPQPLLLPQSPLLQPPSLQLASGQALQMEALAYGCTTHGSARVADLGWTHFGNVEGLAATATGEVVDDGAANSRSKPERGLPDHPKADGSTSAGSAHEGPLFRGRPALSGSGDRTLAMFPKVAIPGGTSFTLPKDAVASADGPIVRGHLCNGPDSTSTAVTVDRDVRAGADDVAVTANHTAGAGADGIGVAYDVMPGRRPSDSAMGLAPPGDAPWVSPRASANQFQRRVAVPPPIYASQSHSSFRSQTSVVSPSLSIHFPEVPDAEGAMESSSAAAMAMALRRGNSINEWPSPASTPSGAAGAVSPAICVPIVTPGASMHSVPGSAGSSEPERGPSVGDSPAAESLPPQRPPLPVSSS